MQNYRVRLESEVSQSYRCTRAANSLDIDAKKKSVHELNIRADLGGEYNVLLIVGASGSGKTTLAKQIFGDDCFRDRIDMAKPIIEQLPADLEYDQCAEILGGVGLTSVPCWIRPAYTLSNGQRARAEAALAMCEQAEITVIDEWTSVVDRTVAKVMSHCVQKSARRNKKKIALLSCHYDVIEWLDPDLVIDCNEQTFIDRRLLPPEQRQRSERLNFEIKKVGRHTWPMFSKYHYLSDRLPGGLIETFGVFHGKNQIGFQCFAEYMPRKKPTDQRVLHSNRTVVHPDYAGFGLGVQIINATSQLMVERGFKVMAKFSSVPVYKAFKRSPYWKLQTMDKILGNKQYMLRPERSKTLRKNTVTYSFKFTGIPRAEYVRAFGRNLDLPDTDLEYLISP